MRAIGAAVGLVVVLSTAACGQQGGSSTSSGSSAYAGCDRKGTVVARADLNGDGSPEEIRLTQSGAGRCADSLVAKVGDTVAGTGVGGLALVPQHAKAVHLRGDRPRDLVLLWEAPHPRGGSQPHLFAAGGSDGLREVTTGGTPVVPFVATDGGVTPMTAICTPDGGIAVFTSVTHQPPGIILAWDVSRTTYDIRNGRAVNAHTTMFKEAAADPVLRKEMPELYTGVLFADCS